MVKIVSKRPIGIQPVYDIGVAKDHNFLLANGLVASNCFNKSHSTAYAYVTYQTAYLKANYPVEYMTALLTASSDNQEKVEKYRESCLKMQIEVKPPDINDSQQDFTPQGETIVFGLSAVKNLGQAAIDSIIKAREEAGGKFTCFTDFCSIIDLKAVNRRTLETLIHCGAFDSIHPNRRQLIEALDLIITWIQKRGKEKESGQLNLFDFQVETSERTHSGFENAPSLPQVEDYSVQDKLKFEKEHLGFYVSEHPLKPVRESATLLSPINLNQLEEQKAKQPLCAIVILTSIKKHIAKTSGKPMAFISMEDVSGQVEGVVFPQVYEEINEVLKEDVPLIIWGKVERREDKFQLIVERAELVENVKMVMINLKTEEALDHQIHHKLRGILQEQSGDKKQAKVPVIGIVDGSTERIFVRFSSNYWVQNDFHTVEALKNAGFNAYSQFLRPRKSV
jgi:DNA polymerase-3 subunit alpha